MASRGFWYDSFMDKTATSVVVLFFQDNSAEVEKSLVSFDCEPLPWGIKGRERKFLEVKCHFYSY